MNEWRHNRIGFIPVCVAAVFFACIFSADMLWAAEGAWLTGDALQKALAHKIGITWSNIPLRTALAGLAKSQKIAVLVDRRVDPNQKIKLSLDDVPVVETFQRIASRVDTGTAMLGSVAYFGPAATARRLATVAALRKDDAAKLPAAVRARWMQPKPLKWDDLATPRDLLASLAKEIGLTIDGLERIPHDLWGAADLPPISLADRLSLILCQFDLTFELAADGQSIRLVPMPEKPVIERSYAVPKPAEETAARLRGMKLLADADIRAADGKLIVRGRQEDQDAVAEILSGHTARRTTVTEGQQVYSLKVELPVKQLIESLCKKMDLELHMDEPAITAAGLSLEKSVKLDVQNVSADDLLHAVLDPAGLTFTHRGNVVEVKAK